MENRALSFDSRAGSFFKGHPGYPEELVDEVLKFSQFPAAGKMLEIGAGSGQATLPFARRGIRITAVEPGQNMVNHALPLLDDSMKVDFVVSTFDEWPLEKEAYDLIISARAIHWVHEKLRFTKTADALRPGGYLALFKNLQIQGEQPLHEEIRQLIQKYRSLPKQERATESERQFQCSKNFEPVTVKEFPWSLERDAATYVEAQKVRLEFHKLSDEQRAELFSAMYETIMQHGGTIHQKYETVLFIAKKRKSTSWIQRLRYPAMN